MPFLAPSPAQVIAKAVAAQRKIDRGSASFSFKTVLKGKTTTVHGSLQFSRGSAITLRLKESSLGRASDRIYHVQGDKFVGYDYYGDESMHRTVPGGRSLSRRLAYVFGAVPDPVEAAIDPEWTAGFLRGVSKAASVNKAGTAMRGSGPNKFQTFQANFDKSGRLTSFDSHSGLTLFSWTLSYSSSYKPPTVPTGGAEVKVFTPHNPPPSFQSEAARSLCLSAVRGFRKLRAAKVMVMRPGKQVVVYWDRGKLRQSSGNATWAYDGKTLYVSVNGKFFRGKASHADTLDYLSYLAGGEDTFARTFLLSGNIMESFLSPTDAVRAAGKVTIQGVPQSILEITGPGGRSSVAIRADDHLIASAESDSLGTDGKVAFHDEVTYKYLPFKPDSSFFVLHSKLKPRPLPKAAIKMGSRYYHPELQYEMTPLPLRGKPLIRH